MTENNTAPDRGGHDRWTSRHQRGRAYDRTTRRNSTPPSTRSNHSPIRRSSNPSRTSYPYRQSHSSPPNRHNSTTNTPHYHCRYAAPSHPNDLSSSFVRDIYHPKYHNKIRCLISEGSQLSQQLQEFLKDVENVLKSDPEEMDWDHTSQKEVVSDGRIRVEAWEEIGPEVKNPFERVVLEAKLTVCEKRDHGQEEGDARNGVEESESP